MISIASPLSSDVRRLLSALDDTLLEHTPEEHAGIKGPEWLADQRAVVFVCQDPADDHAAGMVALIPATGEALRLYVDPSHRGRGIVEGLLAALEAHARGLGITNLWLETGPLPQYAGARRALLKAGYVVIDHPRTNEWCVFMAKDIRPGY